MRIKKIEERGINQVDGKENTIMTKIRDVFGIEHETKLISNPNSPYLEYEYTVVQKMYNPNKTCLS